MCELVRQQRLFTPLVASLARLRWGRGMMACIFPPPNTTQRRIGVLQLEFAPTPKINWVSNGAWRACMVLQVLTKSYRTMPDKWHGLTDVEKRYRQRYVDLIASPAVKDTFQKRSLILSTLRRSLEDSGFLEVETPVRS